MWFDVSAGLSAVLPNIWMLSNRVTASWPRHPSVSKSLHATVIAWTQVLNFIIFFIRHLFPKSPGLFSFIRPSLRRQCKASQCCSRPKAQIHFMVSRWKVTMELRPKRRFKKKRYRAVFVSASPVYASIFLYSNEKKAILCKHRSYVFPYFSEIILLFSCYGNFLPLSHVSFVPVYIFKGERFQAQACQWTAVAFTHAKRMLHSALDIVSSQAKNNLSLNKGCNAAVLKCSRQKPLYQSQ